MKQVFKKLLLISMLGSSLLLASCSGNVGIGLNVGIPIGNHGYMSVGSSRWY
jgi:hypothetical protein